MTRDPAKPKHLSRWNARRVDYDVQFRNGGWYIIETSRYGETLRGPLPSQAAAFARLAQYGYGNKPKPPEQ